MTKTSETFEKWSFSGDPDELVTLDDYCACCEKRIGYVVFPRRLGIPTHYCETCRRAIRIAKMSAEGKFPENV